VGEVDQLEDAVDERVAERDECVERTVREPDLEDPKEQVPVLDQIDDQPSDDEGDEEQPDRWNDVRRGRAPTLDEDTVGLYLGGDVGLLSTGEGPSRALPQSGRLANPAPSP